MNTTGVRIKRYLVSEYGQEEARHFREFVVEMPEGSDPERLDGEILSEAADEAAIGWEIEESYGVWHDHYDVKGSADEMECDGLPVIRLDVSAEEGSDD